MQITPLPLDSIDAAALPRDRTTLPEPEMDLLRRSILAEGLRLPIEVFALAIPEPPILYGLISGLRRLNAMRQLNDMLPGRFATIPALIRQPADIPGALSLMVAENEIRAPVSPWEKALLILDCVQQGHFDTPDAAIAGLFPLLSPTHRSRLRAVVHVAYDLDGILTDGPAYSLRQLLRIAAALKAGFDEVIEVALREHDDQSQPAQWDLLQNILAEAELSQRDPAAFEPAPKRLSRPHQRGGLTIRREWLPNGWRLVFTGPEAKGMMIESVMRDIERKYGPPPK